MGNWQKQAQELWGFRWKAVLASTAGITKRTVQRWNSGENKPNPDVISRLDATYKIWFRDG